MCATNQLPYGLKLKIWRGKELPVIFLYFQENKYTQSSGNLGFCRLLGFIWCSFESTETGEKVLCNPYAHSQDGYGHHLYLCSWQSEEIWFFIRAVRPMGREGIVYTQYLIICNYTYHFHNMDICLKCLISCMNYFRYKEMYVFCSFNTNE